MATAAESGFGEWLQAFTRQFFVARIDSRPEDLPPVLYHYTDANGFLGILRDQVLWASDVRFLNDPLEPTYGLDVVKSLVSGPFSAKYVRTTGLLRQALDDHVPDRRETAYVLSLSKKGDLLSQWRAYASDGSGYAIGFDTSEQLCAPEAFGVATPWTKVLYEPSEQVAYLESYLRPLAEGIESATDIQDRDRAVTTSVLRTLVRIALAAMKQDGFSEEEEWRAVYSLAPSDHVLKCRASRGHVVPYLELHPVPHGRQELAITEVILGPRLGDRALAATAAALRASEYGAHFPEAGDTGRPGSVAVRRSKIQYGV